MSQQGEPAPATIWIPARGKKQFFYHNWVTDGWIITKVYRNTCPGPRNPYAEKIFKIFSKFFGEINFNLS